MEKPVELTRTELYEELWRTPSTKVAAKYGISDVGLVKVCRRYNIPKPPLGYWAKVAHGQKPDQEPLPPTDDPKHEQVSFGGARPDCADGGEEAAEEKYPPVPVATRLTSPHPAVGHASDFSSGGYSRNEGLVVIGGRHRASIAVSSQNVGRAMRIMDAFLKAVEGRGCRIAPSGEWAHADMVIHSSTSKYPFQLRERKKRHEKPLTPERRDHLKCYGYLWDRYEYKPTGQLVLSIGVGYSHQIVVADSARKKLEEKVGEAVGRLFEQIAVDDEEAKKREIEAREQERVRQEAERRAAEEERIRQVEQKRVNGMQQQLANWRLARDIREYVATIDAALRKHGAQTTAGGPLDVWLNWLYAHAKKIDPLTVLYDELEEFSAKMAAQRASEQPEVEDISGHA